MTRFVSFSALALIVCFLQSLSAPTQIVANEAVTSQTDLTEAESEADADESPAEEKPADAEKAESPSESSESEAASEEKESTDKETAEKDSTDDDKPATDEKAAEKDKEGDAAKTEPKSDEKADEKAEPKKRKTHTVEPKRLKVDLPLEGTFVASKTTEVPLHPEAWSDFEIVEVAKLGAKVRKGDVLFNFDSLKLNEAIADLELEQRLNELSILRSEEELPRLEKTLTMDLAQAERTNKEAKEDFTRYTEIDRPMIVKAAEFMTKYYQFMLDYEKDELDQLMKMYEADDLTEETEEIVLKRQKSYVEVAEFNLESAKLTRDERLNVLLPRYDIEIKESLERAALAMARAKMAFELDLNRARYELEQRKQARTKSLERHAKLIVDRGLMEIKSPADGVVYYGQSVNGRWGETAALINKYQAKNNVMPSSVLMTIVEPRPLYVTSTFDEGKRPEVSTGQAARISPPAEGSERVSGKVEEISPIPVSPGKFEIRVDPVQDELPEWVVAGMSCKLKVNTYDKADALTVPKAAVHIDKEDEDVQYVWLVDAKDAEAKPERRTVKIGRRSGDDVEIIEGLKKGDVISLEDESKEAEKKKAES